MEKNRDSQKVEVVDSKVLLLTGHWWALVIRGVLALLFGLLVMIWPPVAIEFLVFFFGAFALLDGLFALVAGLQHHVESSRPILILQAVCGILAGMITFLWPGMVAFVLLIVIGAWAIVTGIFEIVASFQMPSAISGKSLLGISGFISVLFGLILLSPHGLGILALCWLIGIYAIFAGLIMLGAGFTARAQIRT